MSIRKLSDRGSIVNTRNIINLIYLFYKKKDSLQFDKTAKCIKCLHFIRLVHTRKHILVTSSSHTGVWPTRIYGINLDRYSSDLHHNHHSATDSSSAPGTHFSL